MDMSCADVGADARARFILQEVVFGRPRERRRGRRLPGRRYVALTAVGAALVLVLVGCASTPPEPQQTFAEYTASSTPTPMPMPMPTLDAAPVRPADMERTDEVGAAAAAMYFLELYQHVLATGSTNDWEAVSAADCEFCGRVLEDANRVHAAAGRITGSQMILGSPVVLPAILELGGFPVQVEFTMAAGAELDESGVVVTSTPDESGYAVVDTVHATQGWVLVEVSYFGVSQL